MDIPTFEPFRTILSYDEVQSTFYNILCPQFVKHYKPYFSIIRGGIFYKLFMDVKHNRYSLEVMLQSGQIDKHTQLRSEKAIEIRKKCATNLKLSQYHRPTEIEFKYKFNKDEYTKCYKCSEYKLNEEFTFVFNNRLAKSCFECRGKPKPLTHRYSCSKCI